MSDKVDALQDRITQLESEREELVEAATLIHIANNMSNVNGWHGLISKLKGERHEKINTQGFQRKQQKETKAE